jgi:hypothetical protein
VPVAAVIQRINEFMAGGMKDFGATKAVSYESVGNPERDAIAFYMMNHAVTLVRGKKHAFEPLGQYLPMVDEYFNMMAIRAVRMFFYLFMICTREARHTPDPTGGHTWAKWAQTYGHDFKTFIASMSGMSPDAATKHIYKQKPPGLTLGQHCNGLVDVFMSSSWGLHPSFGGKNWGKIAEVLRDFVEGKITAEMMLDTSFTLAHNGGPIFNKGMMYEGWGQDLFKILDVQRSGQVPQLIAQGGGGVTQATSPEITRLYNLCHAVLGEDFEGYVDWFKVQELGAVKNYTKEQQAQLAKYGPPITAKHIKEAEEAIATIADKKAQQDSGLLIPIFEKQTAKKVGRVYA